MLGLAFTLNFGDIQQDLNTNLSKYKALEDIYFLISQILDFSCAIMKISNKPILLFLKIILFI